MMALLTCAGDALLSFWICISLIVAMLSIFAYVIFENIFKSSACFLTRLFFDIGLYGLFLYILEINSLVGMYLQIFSPILPVVFLFLLMVSFAGQKSLSLIRSHLSIFAFILPWETDLRK